MLAAAWRLLSLPIVLLALLLAGTPQFPALQRAIAQCFRVHAPTAVPSADVLHRPAGATPRAAAADASTPAARSDNRSGRGVLVPLYLSFAALQALDAHSTFRALDAGGAEANPLMAGLAGNRAAFMAVKAGVTASTIYLVEKVRVKSRTAAVVLMAAINSAYATIVAHNYRVTRR